MKVEKLSHPCHFFFFLFFLAVLAGFNIGRGLSRGMVGPFVSVAQRSMGISVKSRGRGGGRSNPNRKPARQTSISTHGFARD